MVDSAISEALRAPAQRTTQFVREHEILRVAASVDGDDRLQSIDKVRREILTWAQNRSGGRLPKQAWDHKDFEYFSGGRNSVGVRLQDDEVDLWAIRADDPDKFVPGRVWTTEVVLGLMGNNAPRLSARLLVSTPERNLDIEPHTPGFVQQIVDRCGLSRDGLELVSQPWVVDGQDDVEHLLDLIVSPTRVLPLFVVSLPDFSQVATDAFVEPFGLMRAVIGTAQVVIVPAQHTWALTERFGRARSVFGGAIRVYLPGFEESSNPYAHRLIRPEELAKPGGAAAAQRDLRWLAASESVRRIRMGQDILAFAAIRAASLKLRQSRLETEGASESEQLLMAKVRIGALEAEIISEKAAQQFFAEEHDKAEARAIAAEEQLRTSAFRIQQLTQQLVQRGEAPDTNIELPSDWPSFANWVDTNLAGRVVLAPRARNGVRAPEFEDVSVAAQCLMWLANEGRQRRIEGGEGSLGEQAIADGIRNSHCGGDEFEISWQGHRHAVDWHIKSGGNTRDPRRCLRIYYFWDPATQQIVVAEMPAHRRTSAT